MEWFSIVGISHLGTFVPQKRKVGRILVARALANSSDRDAMFMEYCAACGRMIGVCVETDVIVSKYCYIDITIHQNTCLCNSESTAEGRRITRLDRILLNGNNITMVSIVNFSSIVIFAAKLRINWINQNIYGFST